MTGARERGPELPRKAYSVPEVARMLGLSRSYAYALVARGEIPSTRFGGRVVVPARPSTRGSMARRSAT